MPDNEILTRKQLYALWGKKNYNIVLPGNIVRAIDRLTDGEIRIWIYDLIERELQSHDWTEGDREYHMFNSDWRPS